MVARILGAVSFRADREAEAVAVSAGLQSAPRRHLFGGGVIARFGGWPAETGRRIPYGPLALNVLLVFFETPPDWNVDSQHSPSVLTS